MKVVMLLGLWVAAAMAYPLLLGPEAERIRELQILDILGTALRSEESERPEIDYDEIVALPMVPVMMPEEEDEDEGVPFSALPELDKRALEELDMEMTLPAGISIVPKKGEFLDDMDYPELSKRALEELEMETSLPAGISIVPKKGDFDYPDLAKRALEDLDMEIAQPVLRSVPKKGPLPTQDQEEQDVTQDQDEQDATEDEEEQDATEDEEEQDATEDKKETADEETDAEKELAKGPESKGPKRGQPESPLYLTNHNDAARFGA